VIDSGIIETVKIGRYQIPVGTPFSRYCELRDIYTSIREHDLRMKTLSEWKNKQLAQRKAKGDDNEPRKRSLKPGRKSVWKPPCEFTG
jgi:hypothetical protein